MKLNFKGDRMSELRNLRHKWAMTIYSTLSQRWQEDGYDDQQALYESFKLADEAIAISNARAKEKANERR